MTVTDDSCKIVKVIFKILLIMGVIELMIMMVGQLFALDLKATYLALIDAVFLILLSTPFIVWWVVKPYAKKQQEAIYKANFIAFHDPLTKLPNRRLLTEHIDKCLSVSSRNDYVSALIFIDLDDFKPINDIYGHATGDEVLIEVANRLNNSVRAEDIVSRHGGDEFIIFLQDSGVSCSDARVHILKVVDKIRASIGEPILINNQQFQVGCSFGISILTGNWVSSALAIHEADVAMYQAKKLKEHKVVFADDVVIDWYSNVETGIVEIDREHQQIDYLIKNSIASTEDRIDSLQHVTEALKKHFHSEEWISIQKSLNMTDGHIKEHRRLEVLLTDLSNNLDASNALDALKLIQQIIKSHIASFDLNLSNIDKEKISQAAAE